MDLNRVTLIGNLTKDPAKKASPSGQSISEFSLATNYRTEAKETVEFHDIVAWGKLADIISQYVKKGSKVYVEGRLHTNGWKDKAGKPHKKTEIVADNLIMLGHRGKKEVQVPASA
ncbi:MAG: single-stranded DNA-binding protein [Candidatus Kerfeldbacteria bacterium]|nr:single-stranded DNA-binding protein [Candidatus Kerfeldbacteria bacterium]